MECVRLQVENPSDSKNTKDNMKKYLLAQTRSLVNHWIIKFDPMSQNSTAKEDGLEYLSMTEGINLLDYTQSII